MAVIKFLGMAVAVLALVFVIGVIFNLILDVVIIQPILNRQIFKRKLELMDILNDKISKCESIEKVAELNVDDIEKEIEK